MPRSCTIDIARKLFAHPATEVLGWQFLLEAFTGLRTSEALQLRTDAAPGAPGHLIVTRSVEGAAGAMGAGTACWRALDIGRCKNGINPFVVMTPHLEKLLRALFLLEIRPSRALMQSIKDCSFRNHPGISHRRALFRGPDRGQVRAAHALVRVSAEIGPQVHQPRRARVLCHGSTLLGHQRYPDRD